jgi:hypothetical protein
VAGTVTFIELVSGGLTGTPAKVINGTTVSGWVNVAGSVAVNADIFLTGSNSVSDKVSAGTAAAYGLGAGLVGEPWDFSSGGVDEGNHIFMIANIGGTADTLANGGFGIIVADDLASDSGGTWYCGPQIGSLSGWEYFVINPVADFDEVIAGTATWTLTGNPAQLSGVDGIGVRWKVTNSVMGASDNAFLQSMSIGAGYRVTGTSSLFSDFSTYETTNRYGALQTKSGILFPLGKLRIGVESGAGNTTFTDSGFTVIWQGATLSGGTNPAVADGFYELSVVKGSGTTDVTLSNGTLAAASPCTFDLELNGSTTVTITNLAVDRARLVTLDSAVTWNGGTVKNSGQITASAAIFKDVAVLTSTVAADVGAVRWNDAGDPDGNLDGCSFTKGTNAHHAIEFGASAPLTMTLRDMVFGTSWNAANGNNDSTLLFADRGSDQTWTVNLVGCTGTITYKKARAGDTVNLVVNPVSLSVHVQDVDTGSPISGARVWVPVTSGAGGYPYNASITSINRSGATATVVMAAPHSLSNNDYVDINGATELEYNGTFQITVTSTTDFTYTVTGTPATPAGGTKTATFVVISGTTDGSGDISKSKSYSAAQPVSGRVRTATGAGPYYKTAPISGTISTTAGLSVTVQMIPDS